MGWFKRKTDPISARARKLNAEIAALEEKIKMLEGAAEAPRSSPGGGGNRVEHNLRPAARLSREPVFEEVDRFRLSQPETASGAAHGEDMRVHKGYLAILWQRCRGLFRTPTPNNPRLVNYLAAGTIQGLRPLRYEKRIARNRVIGLCLIFLVLLLAIVGLIVRHW
jgi:hypothetical protein